MRKKKLRREAKRLRAVIRKLRMMFNDTVGAVLPGLLLHHRVRCSRCAPKKG